MKKTLYELPEIKFPGSAFFRSDPKRIIFLCEEEIANFFCFFLHKILFLYDQNKKYSVCYSLQK